MLASWCDKMLKQFATAEPASSGAETTFVLSTVDHMAEMRELSDHNCRWKKSQLLSV
jgi:hypothetical protein